MSEAQCETQPLLMPEDVDRTPVYPIIHMIKSDIVHFIDTPLSYDALSAPDLTYTLVRPLEEKYTNIIHQGNMSVVFCFLLNRAHFLRDQSLTSSSLSRSRAALCEILAIRTLRAHADNILEIALAITTSWSVYSGADPDVIAQAREDRDELEDRVGNAIEMAIIGNAKRFIKNSACQKVINAIWTGKCVYQAESSHSILSDTYKRNPIHFYDPHKAPLLDHYRLKVPAIRLVLEYLNFLCLFVLFVLAIELDELDRLNAAEVAFMIYGLGFTLEKVASMQEHGARVYFTGIWNGFDLAFVTIYCTYAFLRLYGVFHHSLWARSMGTDCLALIACLMFPRLAFVTLRNNLMVLSLRAMIVQFVILMLIATFCFGGFLYALWTLSRNAAGYSAGQIAWWMLDIWFGLDASGFERASHFHPIFGPLLVVAYACLSNTLLLTVLVSILSHTFSTITEDAAAEAMFRRAVSTIEGVKADPLFSYLPPINLVALVIMFPMSYILSPRWFHKVNVFMIRLTNFPILLCIAWYERQAKSTGSLTFSETVKSAAEKVFDTLPRQIKRFTFFEGFAGDSGIDAVFELSEEWDGSALDISQDFEGPEPPQPPGSRRPSSQSSPKKPAITVKSPTSPPERKLSLSIPQQQASNDQQQASTSSDQSPPPVHSPRRRANTTMGPPLSPHSPRQRASSLMHRGAEAVHTFASPLAQIFQPLVVDDDQPIDDHEQPQPTSPVVSFGPATRRRMSSMHKRTGSDQNATGVRFPGMRARQGSIAEHPLFESSDQDLKEHEPEEERKEQPEMATKVEEEERSEGMLEWHKRFEMMEERQLKIESMLIEIMRAVREK